MRRDLAICVGLLVSILCGLQPALGDASDPAALPARLYAFDGVSYVGEARSTNGREWRADVTAEYRVRVLSDGGASIRLLPPETAIWDLKVVKGDAHIRRTRAGCELLTTKRGDLVASLSFRVNVHAQAKTYSLELPLVPHALTTVSLRIPQADIKVVTTPSVPVLIEQPSPGITLATFAPAVGSSPKMAELNNSADASPSAAL
ncbi:MAG: hypothetical protein FJ279_22075, partial [Planctomycetes bacterium]|nr:hypothetical protein [Planctomycetota bacterium]